MKLRVLLFLCYSPLVWATHNHAEVFPEEPSLNTGKLTPIEVGMGTTTSPAVQDLPPPRPRRDGATAHMPGATASESSRKSMERRVSSDTEGAEEESREDQTTTPHPSTSHSCLAFPSPLASPTPISSPTDEALPGSTLPVDRSRNATFRISPVPSAPPPTPHAATAPSPRQPARRAVHFISCCSVQ